MAKTKPMAAAAGEKKKSKGKKKGKNGPAKVAMKARAAAAEERSNPFEAIWSRRKFDVLGKKRKGEERRVSRARSEAIRKVSSSSSAGGLRLTSAPVARFGACLIWPRLAAEGEHAAQGVRGERQVVRVPRPAYRREGRRAARVRQGRPPPAARAIGMLRQEMVHLHSF